MPEKKDSSYSSDLSVSQYERIAVYLPPKKITAPRRISYHAILNAILNAIFYRLKNGCTWKDLPKDFPPYKTVFHYFNQWKKQGVWDRMLDDLKTENRTAQKKTTANVADR